MKFLSVVPQEARALFENGEFLPDKNQYAREAAKRLVTDRRLSESWVKLTTLADPSFSDEYGSWSESFVRTTANEYSEAVRERRAWFNMTLKEQAEWRRNVFRAGEDLIRLSQIGPNPMVLSESYILATDYDGEQMRERQASEQDNNRAEGSQDLASQGQTGQVEDELDNFIVPWGLSRVDIQNLILRMVDRQLESASDLRQSLKKPRDKHAGRARFLQQMTKWCLKACHKRLQGVVSNTASVLLEDEGISVRLVQQHTKGI